MLRLLSILAMAAFFAANGTPVHGHSAEPRTSSCRSIMCCPASLSRLVDAGNTVIVIEHNLDVIKTADWIIDLGPEGGERGGEVVVAGTPEKVAASAASATGEYLSRVLRGEPLIPLSGVSFAEAAGRPGPGASGNGREPALRKPAKATKVKRAATAAR